MDNDWSSDATIPDRIVWCGQVLKFINKYRKLHINLEPVKTILFN
jgi:hypothetical protein